MATKENSGLAHSYGIPRLRWACAAGAIVVGLAQQGRAQTVMTNLGSLGASHSGARGVSADGSVIVGWTGPFAGGPGNQAFRWSQDQGMVALSLPPSYAQPNATAVSRDGSTIVGSDAFFDEGFRWRTDGTIPLWGRALAVSSDGEKVHGFFNVSGLTFPYRFAGGATSDVSAILSVIVSAASDGDVVVGAGLNQRAARYSFATSTLTDLGTLPGGAFSTARAITDDASVVVGDSNFAGAAPGGVRAFRWTASGGMQDLGTLGGATSRAFAVSDDGAIVVGESLDGSGNVRAFRWTAATGMVDLGTLGGAQSRALAITPDGALIVGEAQAPGGGWRAFVHGDDCDADGTPDVYALRADPLLDCNANGVLDACDLASGASQDVNQNGRPDECDCLSGATPTVYCTAKLNSQLCLPSIDISAAPSVSGAGSSVVVATNIINDRNGLLYYGYQPNAAPFQGGTLCVQGPLRRTPPQNSGALGASDPCAGRFEFDLNAYIASGADPLLQVVGQTFACQYWSRDPGDPFGSSLTNAVQGQVCQ